MCLPLLLQQSPACFICLTWMVFEMGGKWQYSCCFIGCFFKSLFKTTHSNIYIYIYIQTKDTRILFLQTRVNNFCHWSGRLGFNPRSNHTKDSKNSTWCHLAKHSGEQSWEWSSTLPSPQCSKGSLRVTLD